MSVHEQTSTGKGSLLDIQKLINDKPNLLNSKIQSLLKITDAIEWVSPLKCKSYAEYRDGDFLAKLGITPTKVALKDFWPNRGPQWDALGKTDREKYFLVEAKAHISELKSSPSGAKAEESTNLIDKALAGAQAYFGISEKLDRNKPYYQYINRLAHVYYLRELNGLDAYLINVCFLNDESVGGPATEKEWHAAINKMKTAIGLDITKNAEYIINVFIDAKVL